MRWLHVLKPAREGEGGGDWNGRFAALKLIMKSNQSDMSKAAAKMEERMLNIEDKVFQRLVTFEKRLNRVLSGQDGGKEGRKKSDRKAKKQAELKRMSSFAQLQAGAK
eukprot:CAMPEP_0113893576 /NCGR_PEP_ID=MMETSP0780_2-20120614/16177_1 /TAXON_ID=652834 /ORGANISM="Palpitomonas bilix" /LENGTH=107 /DNA_ID=CAMNT_0000883897 /DNA_START=69 /DNA_END=392 /DNA_ORIENTATION=- /assembly_acc=CAM_ASM_000599